MLPETLCVECKLQENVHLDCVLTQN
jgi:hypothetical protein